MYASGGRSRRLLNRGSSPVSDLAGSYPIPFPKGFGGGPAEPLAEPAREWAGDPDGPREDGRPDCEPAGECPERGGLRPCCDMVTDWMTVAVSKTTENMRRRCSVTYESRERRKSAAGTGNGGWLSMAMPLDLLSSRGNETQEGKRLEVLKSSRVNAFETDALKQGRGAVCDGIQEGHERRECFCIFEGVKENEA